MDIITYDPFEPNRRALPSPRPEWKFEVTEILPSPSPEPERITEDDAKIERQQEQARRELEQAITAAGEAGWRSMYYTGPANDVVLPSLRIYPYRQWMLARSDYVRTGDEQYKEAMLKVVDFDNPPDASVPRVPEPAPAERRGVSPAQAWRAAKRKAFAVMPKNPAGKALGGAVLVLASVYAAVGTAIMLLAVLWP